MTDFATIGLIGRLDSDSVGYSLQRLIHFLRKRQLAYILETETATLLTDQELLDSAAQVAGIAELGRHCDLVIVVGGDGSLLRGARALAEHDVPLLGINRGRLGFLTDIAPDEIEAQVGAVLAGEYHQEHRFLLDMRVVRGEMLVGQGDALNDVVLHPGEFIRMMVFELYVNGQFVTSQRADGMIVSTPTGSTAYALSAGGPILHPELDAVVLVPMNPHTLSSRPIVVPGNSEIRILLSREDSASPHVTCDGQTHVVCNPGDEIFIHKKPHHIRLLHPLHHNFYERCRSKLGWGGHLLDVPDNSTDQ